MNATTQSRGASVRVRLAPSPTGPLHIGTARAALFNYLFARQRGGVFVLRVEDTDPVRSKPEWERAIIEGLSWLGLSWDEGPDKSGPYAPYRQSERVTAYRTAVATLIASGHAYRCFCTTAQLEADRAEQETKKLPPRYVGRCRTLDRDESLRRAHAGESFIVRCKTPPSESITFSDLVRGEVSFGSDELGDFSIGRGEGEALYNLAVVVDDHAMAITHVLRGEDHLSNTPKQLLLYRAFGWTEPVFGHLPLILAPDRSKLSKRNATVDLADYRRRGFLPSALVNFMALLGWNPGTTEEVFSLKELVKSFSIERVQRAGAVFDERRLRWLNGHYIKALPARELAERSLAYLESSFDLSESDRDPEALAAALAIARDRMETLADCVGLLDFLYVEPAIDPALVVPNGQSTARITELLEKVGEVLTTLEPWRADTVTAALESVCRSEGVGRGDVFWPLRVALTGKRRSPGASEVAGALGKERTLDRLSKAVHSLRSA